jgi:ADP-ribose pyrophosphatase YjhB (NUDIX family)
VTAALAANAAIPAGLLAKRPALDAEIAGAKKHAAGILHVAPDGDVLLLRRAGTPGVDNFVGHWALPGGGVEEGETPQVGAARENKEEMGVDVDPSKLKVFDQTMTPTGGAFHTFASPADKKFWPALNDEHSGAGWFPLSELPHPLHPAVEASLKGRLGDDLPAARDGLVAWSKAAEEEHPGASDSAELRTFLIAMDRDSVREKTREGRLIVKRTPISKANVCPYRGEEIPGWEALGLDKDRVYNLLRDPDELRKAAPTLNGVQLLIKHIPVSAKDDDSHRPMETVGSVGTDAEFDGEYLYNSLFVNAKKAIDGIETNKQRELSPGYHYKPDMTPGIFRGTAFDGVMRDIVFNHVCLVEDGRTGPDVLVADEALKEQDMTKVTRFGAMTLSLVAGAIAPLLAMDQKVTLSKDLFAPLTTKNFKTSREALLSGVRTAIDGKLRSGIALDATMKDFAKAVDAFSDDMTAGIDEPAPEDKMADLDKMAAVEPAKGITEPGSTYDAEPLKGFLRDCGMDEDKIAKCMDMMPKSGLAGDAEESDEDKKAREKKEADEKAAKDSEMKDMVTKPAMDAAITAAVSAATKQARETEQGIRVALSEVKPYVGELPASMAFDSAAGVYRHALTMRGVDGAKTLHADALLPVLKSLQPTGAKPAAQSAVIAMDGDVVKKAIAMAPGLENISTSL